MKKIVLVFLMFGLCGSGILYAADGDLIVNGKVGIGTSNPTGKLEICDQGACIRWVRVMGNYGGDEYGANYQGTQADTCNGSTTTSYGCNVGESRTCIDALRTEVWDDNLDDYVVTQVYRTVRCYVEHTLELRTIPSKQ